METVGQFLSVVDGLDAIVYVADMNTREVLFINRHGSDLLGDATGRLCWESIQKGQRGPCDFCTNKYLLDEDGRPGEVYTWEFKNTATGRWFLIKDRAIVWVDGRIVRLEIATDITERKNAEAKLRESEEEYKDLFEGASDMIQIVLPGGWLRYVNPNWCRAFGYSAEEAAGLSVFDLIAKDCHGHCQETFSRVLAEGTVSHFETAFLSKEGERILIEGSATCRYEGGAPLYSRCFLRDVTERKRAEEELREAKRNLELQNEELKKLDRMKDSLLRDVAHELKTPVAKHAMQLEILGPFIASLQKGGREAKAFQIMGESVRRQEDVIRNLLDLARLETEGRVYDRQEVALDTIVSRVRSDYRDMLAIHGAELDVKVPPLFVMGGGEMLWHVFSNIINNAIKFRRKDEALKIRVTAESRDGEVHVRISDSGIGLEEADIQKLFTRFYQVSPSAEGSGVGLAICRRIVEDQGGKIWLDSEGPGKGVTVSVTLPRAAGKRRGREH